LARLDPQPRPTRAPSPWRFPVDGSGADERPLRDARLVVEIVRADQPPHEFDESRLGLDEPAARHVGDDQRTGVDERIVQLAALAFEPFD